MKRSTQIRAVFVCAILALGFSRVSCRLIEIQVGKHEYFTARAAENHLVTVPITAKRGLVFDRRGDLLAGNVPVKTVALDGATLDPVDLIVPIVAKSLEIPEEKIRTQLNPKDRYILLKSNVEENVVEEMQAELNKAVRAQAEAEGKKEIKVAGLILEQGYRRVYPHGRMLCHVVGYYGWDDKKVLRGMHGVERTMDAVLTGANGFRYIEKDARRRELVPYRGGGQPAVDGSDVVLTVERGLQTIVEDELEEAVKKYKPKAATIIFMRPATGEILGMASWPSFDPTSPSKSPENAQLNLAVAGVVEPGSTFKIVAVGGALNEGFVDLNTIVFCENGRYQYAGHVLGDHRSYGDLTVREIITQSSNIGAAKLGIQLGAQRFYNYVRRFGFSFKTGVELPGEHAGLVPAPGSKGWSDVSIAQLPMGQGIAVTPLQMLTAMNVIANGGKLVAPRIVMSIVPPGSGKAHRFQPVVRRQVLSTKAAAQLTIALEDNTGEEGTGSMAKVPGFRTAGKTGTAQKVDPVTKHYYKDRYVVSFAGFLPADNPKICGIVLMDEAKVDKERNYGGQVAAPVFAQVAARIATYLDLHSQAGVTASVAPVDGGAQPGT